MMNKDIDNYNILNESWQKDLTVLQGAERILNLPEKDVQIRKSLSTPTKPEQMPKDIAERQAALAGIFNIFASYDDYGRDATKVLSQLVPGNEDLLPGLAAGIHFTKPSGMAGGVVYLGAAGKSATKMGTGAVPVASPAVHAAALALSSPKFYGKVLHKWGADKRWVKDHLKILRESNLGPFRWAIQPQKLVTTPTGRAVSRQPSRAGRGSAMEAVLGQAYTPQEQRELQSVLEEREQLQ